MNCGSICQNKQYKKQGGEEIFESGESMWKEMRGSIWGYVEIYVPVGTQTDNWIYGCEAQLHIPQLENGLQRFWSLQHTGGI